MSNSTFSLAAEKQHPSLIDPPLAAGGQGPLFESHLSICRRGTALRSHCFTVCCRGAGPNVSAHRPLPRGRGISPVPLCPPRSGPPAPRGAGPGRWGRAPSSISVCFFHPRPGRTLALRPTAVGHAPPQARRRDARLYCHVGGSTLEGLETHLPYSPIGGSKTTNLRGSAGTHRETPRSQKLPCRFSLFRATKRCDISVGFLSVLGLWVCVCVVGWR